MANTQVERYPNASIRIFQEKVWDWYRYNERDLPWRKGASPYEVLVSEVMLQQTQVSRVLVKYAKWMSIFPTLDTLSTAKTSEVIAAWQGLGYNRRGLWLQRASQQIMADFEGVIPSEPAQLETLPGIGPNTAGSIAAFAFNVPVVFIETNIRRVFIHEFFSDVEQVDDKDLIPMIRSAVDHEEPREWYYALMDYGSWLRTQTINPNRRSKQYARQSVFAGSDRQVRGELLRQFLLGPRRISEVGALDERAIRLADQLVKEGFLRVADGCYQMIE
jgi:A/G-specific adenine glycosylase